MDSNFKWHKINKTEERFEMQIYEDVKQYILEFYDSIAPERKPF